MAADLASIREHKAALPALRFLQAHSSHAGSGKLTPAGVRTADTDWAVQQLPELRRRLIKIRETAAKVDADLVARLTEDLAEPVTDPADVALIRTRLRSFREQERLSRARKLASDGDKSSLRALLTAPTYLSGVNAELLTLVRDEAARRAHHDRYAKLEAFRQAAQVAERAVEGVIHYVEQETQSSPSHPSVSAAA